MSKIQNVECREFFLAVTEKANELHAPVAMAVVNAEGHLLALERMEEAGWITPEIAWAKAYSAAAFRSMSPRFPDGLAMQQYFKERNPQLLINAAVFSGGKIAISGGCAPIFRGDEMIGAYGVSGGTSDQDEVMARYAREKVGWAHRKANDDTPQDLKDHINAIYDKVGLSDRKL